MENCRRFLLVWKGRVADEGEILADVNDVQVGDEIVIHMGNVIPFDGVVSSGEGAVNQASMTGESLPVAKEPGGYVYAGTVLEEGELHVKVKETAGSNKYEKIVSMIEETEKLKSSMEGKAEHLADKLVPYTLLGTGIVYLLTRNVTRALSVLMVDFSCALKLAMPISVLSAIREANSHKITVKGGKFLEKVEVADTIIFDKTGTLTKATPTVVEVVPFIDESPNELLRVAAKVGVDEYRAEVLPEEKAQFVEEQRMEGRTVIMVGDGINDSPALSGADVGIAINDGAQIAREIADITIDAGSLNELIILKEISNGLAKRVKTNYKSIVGINSALILLGVCGVIQPTTSALIHNMSTLAVSANSMKDLVE